MTQEEIEIICSMLKPPAMLDEKDASKFAADLRQCMTEYGCDWLDWFTEEWGNAAGQAIAESLPALQERVKKLEKMLSECRSAVASLPEDALGVVIDGNDGSGYPIKAELLHYIDKTLEEQP